MGKLLVVANETIGGRSLLEAVKRRSAEDPDLRIVICVPRTRPKQGLVIYDDATFQAAQVRIDLARKFLRETQGIAAIGEVGDPDPYTAALDAIREHEPDAIVVSTKPATTSGWLRRDLVDRISDASGLPVEHVVTDVEAEGLLVAVSLVVANRTTSSDVLLDRMRERASGGDHEDGRPRLFVVVVPAEGGSGTALAAARGRLGQLLDRARAANLVVAGMVGDPDPYTATLNAVQLLRVDEVLISTLPAERSGWQRAHLVERVRKAVSCPVEHVVVGAQATAGATSA